MEMEMQDVSLLWDWGAGWGGRVNRLRCGMVRGMSIIADSTPTPRSGPHNRKMQIS